MFYVPREFRPRDNIGYLLRHAHGLLQTGYEPLLTARGFTFTQWLVMLFVHEQGTLTAGALCRELRHDAGALTRVLDQLEQRGMMLRSRSGLDRRVVELRLTPAGVAALGELSPLMAEALNDALCDFSQDEFDTFNRLLRKLIARARTRLSTQNPSGQNPPGRDASEAAP